MKIPTLSQRVAEAAKELHSPFIILPEDQAIDFRRQMKGKYVPDADGWLWENFKESSSFQNMNAWMYLDEFLQGRSFILFFNQGDDKSMLQFPSGTRIVPILEECPYFEFYLTDTSLNFLLCFNHHDFLIGCGGAMAWVENLEERLASQT